tara:strand:- start:350 stop:460 length:111 start_codon:yes stop_codon:yes gene_type:complete
MSVLIERKVAKATIAPLLVRIEDIGISLVMGRIYAG